MAGEGLRHPLLEACGVEHGFGTRTSVAPANVIRPKQVHGTAVVVSSEEEAGDGFEADAIVTRVPARPIAVVTADCVPILVASEDGEAVAAIHAGWRGLAAGVIEAGVAAVRGLASSPSVAWVAVVGPHIGPCCYEVDRPVFDAMTQRFTNAEIEAACTPTREDHARIDLGGLSRVALERSGIAPASCGQLEGACTRCDADRFHSFRRDGEAAGRLVHHIASR